MSGIRSVSGSVSGPFMLALSLTLKLTLPDELEIHAHTFAHTQPHTQAHEITISWNPSTCRAPCLITLIIRIELLGKLWYNHIFDYSNFYVRVGDLGGQLKAKR